MNPKYIFALIKRKMSFRNFDIDKYTEIFGNLRILELTTKKDGSKLTVTISKNKIAFHQDSFDIMIIHSKAPYKKWVYAIPNDKLREHKCLSDGDGLNGKRYLNFYPEGEIDGSKTFNWIQEFLLHGDDPNSEERLLAICNKQRNHDPKPIVLKNHKIWNIDCEMFHQLLLKYNIPFTFAQEKLRYKYIVWEQRVQELKFRKDGLWFGHGSEDKKYTRDDFDYGYAKLPGEFSDYFYFFPLSVIVEKNLLKRKCVTEIPVKVSELEHWTDEYRFRFDENLYDRLNSLINGQEEFSDREETSEEEIADEKEIGKDKEEMSEEEISDEVEINKDQETIEFSQAVHMNNGEEGMIEEFPPEEEEIFEVGKYHHIIGVSPAIEIFSAVVKEYHEKVTPKVSKNRRNNKSSHMEKYATYLCLYAINKDIYGKAEVCFDGCASDFLYYENDRNRCLGIQVKTTATSYSKNFWQFSNMDKITYNGLLIYMRSLEDGKSWLIPYSILRDKYCGKMFHLREGENTRIDWIDYRIKDSDLAATIHKYYISIEENNTDLSIQTLENILTPVSIETQKEKKNRDILISRLAKININVENVILENMPYDIIINGLKIQEKTSCHSGKGYLNVGLSKTNGKSNSISYSEGDFDALIIHNPEPYEHLTYVIPTDKIKEHGFVTIDDIPGKRGLTLWPDETLRKTTLHNWVGEFLLDDFDPNHGERFLAILDKQRTHNSEPILLKNMIPWNKKNRTLHELMINLNIQLTFAKYGMGYKYLIHGKKIQELKLKKHKKSVFILLSYKTDDEEYYYNKENCDYIYCNFPGEYNNYFYLFPIEIIIDKVKYEQGQLTLPGNPHNIKSKELWLDQYMFNFDDENVDEKLKKSYKNLLFPSLI